MRRLVAFMGIILGVTTVPQTAWAGVGGADCFLCDDYEASTGGWKHTDVILFFNDMHGGGGQHPGGSYGACEEAHMYYTTLAAVPDLSGSASTGADRNAVMLRLLVENDNARINLERSALQIVADDNGAVVVHLPLSTLELASIQRQLDQINATAADAVVDEGVPALRSIVPESIDSQSSSANRHEFPWRKND